MDKKTLQIIHRVARKRYQHLSDEDCEDLAQEVALRYNPRVKTIWQLGTQYRNMFKTRNEAMKFYKETSKRLLKAAREWPYQPEAYDSVSSIDELLDVTEFIRSLEDVRLRTIIIQKYNEATQQEIATLLEMTQTNVFYYLKKFKPWLEEKILGTSCLHPGFPNNYQRRSTPKRWHRQQLNSTLEVNFCEHK